jgi:uncharacterized protein (TIGR02246 family)
MNLRAWGLVCLLAASTLQFANAQNATKGATIVDSSVQSYLTAFITAWNAHDVDAILSLHAEDCVTVNRIGRLFVSRESLRPHMEMLHKELFKDVSFPPFVPLHQRFLTPDLVTVEVAWEDPTAKTGPHPESSGMIVTLLLKRSEKGWLAEEFETHDVEGSPVPGQISIPTKP